MSTTPVTVACEITVEFVDFSIICRTWQLSPLPRVHLWINDGRPFRLTTKHRYDVLIVDPTDPPIFTQYSQDFFPVCHDRLDRGRLMVQWVPLFEYGASTHPNHCAGVPECLSQDDLWYGGTSVLLIGRCGGPSMVNFDQFRQRLKRSDVRENRSLIGNPDARLRNCTSAFGPEALDAPIGQDVSPNTYNRPTLEYSVLRAGKLGMKAMAENLEMLVPHHEPIESILSGARSAPSNLRASTASMI